MNHGVFLLGLAVCACAGERFESATETDSSSLRSEGGPDVYPQSEAGPDSVSTDATVATTEAGSDSATTLDGGSHVRDSGFNTVDSSPHSDASEPHHERADSAPPRELCSPSRCPSGVNERPCCFDAYTCGVEFIYLGSVGACVRKP